MMINRVVLYALIAAFGFSDFAYAHEADITVRMRQPIASVEIGRMPDGRQVLRQLHFGLAVEHSENQHAKKYSGLCAGNAVASAVQSVQVALDSIPDFGEIHKDANRSAEDYEKTLQGRSISEMKDLARARYLEEVKSKTASAVESAGKAIVFAQDKSTKVFGQCMAPNGSGPTDAIPAISLMLMSSTCWEDSSVSGSACAPSHLNVRSNEKAFTRVSKMLPVLGNVVTAGNAMQVEVAPDGSLKAKNYKLDISLAPEPTLVELTVMVSRSAEVARKERRVLDAAVARFSLLTRTDILRVPDLFNYPALAYESAHESGREILTRMNDEFARSRIVECAKVRGIVDLEDASGCAGYKLDVESFESCLNGRACRPVMDGRVRVEMLLSELPLSGEDLLAKWAAPRMNLGAQFGAYEAAGKKCNEESKDAYGATLCLTRELAGKRERETLDCATAALKKSGDARKSALSDCVVDQSSTGKDILKCIKSIDDGELMACAVVAGLNEQDQRRAACIFDNNKSRAEKAVCVAGGDDAAELLRAKQCIDSMGKRQLDVAVCIMGNRMPKDAQVAYECAQQSSSWQAGVGCIAAQNIGGDAGLLARCAVASGGDLGGTAACAVSPGLSPEQQIALQCAMQSPDLTTFAICTGGQLTLREYIKCKDKDVAEDECFGPNNELRKFSRNILGMDIHQDTVVGQALNLQLDVVKGQVALLEAGAAAIKDAGVAIGSFTQGLGDALGRAAQSFDQAARAACGNLCGNWRLPAPRVGVKANIGGIKISF